MRRNHRRESKFWLDLVAEWAASGEGVAPFARRRGVSPSAFQYWVKKQRQAIAPSAAPVRFLPVVAAPVVDSPQRGRFELVVDGARLLLSVDVDPTYVARVLAALRDASC